MASSDLCLTLRQFLLHLSVSVGLCFTASHCVDHIIARADSSSLPPGITYQDLTDNYSDHNASGCQGQAGLLKQLKLSHFV